MSEWKLYRLGDICQVLNGRAYKQEELLNQGPYPVLRVGNIFQGNNWYYSDLELPDDKYCYNGDLLYAWSCGFAPYIWKGKKSIYHYHIWKLKENPQIIDKLFFYYYLIIHTKYNLGGTHGSVMLHLTKKDFENQTLHLPPLEEQRRIAGILGSLDDKIELNRRINANLEAQAQALFRSWFVDNDNRLGNYQTKSLTDIAQYLNGLAMQKFPPESIQNSLPVLKIKELGQGLCDASSDRCSTSIKPEYVINDGDVIFSWSGTLLVDVWCGGKCGLNQHLFKITSNNYPKWFIFHWTKYHLDKFIRIAKDKAVTMGHIKRCDLESSEVKVPEKTILEHLDKIFTPLFNSIIAHRIENRELSALRDTLLPKLMNGEIKI